jgi:hypothetical protein
LNKGSRERTKETEAHENVGLVFEC